MEPPPRELPSDSPAHEEFYLWRATLLEHGQPLPGYERQAGDAPAAPASDQESSTDLHAMAGMKQARENEGALPPDRAQRPTVEPLPPPGIDPGGPANTWSARKQSAVASRRRKLAAGLFVFLLGAMAVVLWHFGRPKGAPAPPTPAAASSPAFPDIPVADVPKTLAASPPPPDPPSAGDGEPEMQRADNVTHAGEVLAASGDLPEALRLYRQALAIRREQAAREPGNVAWQRALAASWTRVADVLKLQGDAGRALGSYRAAEGIEQRCAQAQPGNQDIQRDLFLDALGVGSLLLARNDPAGALEAFRRGSAVQGALCEQNPENSTWKGDLAVSCQRAADALDLLGDDEGALHEDRHALTIIEALVAQDPANSDWRNDLTLTQRRVGDLLFARNETDAALSQYGGALAVLQKLVDLDATNADWQRELAETHDRVGLALEAKKHPDEALPPYQQALAIARNLAAQNTADGSMQGLVASVSYHLGRATVHCQPVDLPAARSALENTRDLLKNLRSADGAAFSREQADMLIDTERLLVQISP